MNNHCKKNIGVFGKIYFQLLDNKNNKKIIIEERKKSYIWAIF